MNQIYISGLVLEKPIFREDQSHVTFAIAVHHRTKAGIMRSESYPVSAWHNCAKWIADNLSEGYLVAIHGYLTQKKDHSIEICAEEVIPSRVISRKAALSDMPKEN